MTTFLRRHPQVALLAVSVVVAAGLVAAGLAQHPSNAHHSEPALFARDWKRSEIYHSPQTPGYTAWVGAWVMPDGSLMTAFTQATGPLNPGARTLMPEPVLEHYFRLTEIRRKGSGFTYRDPRFDFWGLRQQVIYLRSTDGTHWQVWRRDRFRALVPQAYTPQADIALSDGTLIRRVSGVDLPNKRNIPHEALLETLRFNPRGSSQQARHWSTPQVVLHDRSICTYQISRIHQLSGGRLVATGSVLRYAHGSSGPCASKGYSFLLLVAASPGAAERGQWTLGMPYTTKVAPDEWDVAQLPNGNLLALMRSDVNGNNVRLQAMLERRGKGWVMGQPKPLPALAAFQPSGHPDLLATHGGAVVSFSTSGTAYTVDGGRTWSTLTFSGMPGFDLRTRYYPYAIQARNGNVYVFSHNGYDIPYGAFDESIVTDVFKLGGIDGR